MPLTDEYKMIFCISIVIGDLICNVPLSDTAVRTEVDCVLCRTFSSGMTVLTCPPMHTNLHKPRLYLNDAF